MNKSVRKEFFENLIKVLDSAYYDWTLYEDVWGNEISVSDLREAVIYYLHK